MNRQQWESMQLTPLGRLADVVLADGNNGKVQVVGGDPGEPNYCPNGQFKNGVCS